MGLLDLLRLVPPPGLLDRRRLAAAGDRLLLLRAGELERERLRAGDRVRDRRRDEAVVGGGELGRNRAY